MASSSSWFSSWLNYCVNRGCSTRKGKSWEYIKGAVSAFLINNVIHRITFFLFVKNIQNVINDHSNSRWKLCCWCSSKKRVIKTSDELVKKTMRIKEWNFRHECIITTYLFQEWIMRGSSDSDIIKKENANDDGILKSLREPLYRETWEILDDAVLLWRP